MEAEDIWADFDIAKIWGFPPIVYSDEMENPVQIQPETVAKVNDECEIAISTLNEVPAEDKVEVEVQVRAPPQILNDSDPNEPETAVPAGGEILKEEMVKVDPDSGLASDSVIVCTQPQNSSVGDNATSNEVKKVKEVFVDMSRVKVVIQNFEEIRARPVEAHIDPAITVKVKTDENLSRPIVQRSVKKFVPPDQKTDKYWAKRAINNVAAKKCRDAARVKENEMKLRAVCLEERYAKLQEEFQEALAKKEERMKLATASAPDSRQVLQPTVLQYLGKAVQVEVGQDGTVIQRATESESSRVIYLLGNGRQLYKVEMPTNM